MKLNCAILHQDAGLQDQLMKYIEKVPFLCCCGAYNNALEALKAYYEKKVEVYFIGIGTVKEGEIDGRDFCKLLDLYTRVIFIADTDRYAAECFWMRWIIWWKALISQLSFRLLVRLHAGFQREKMEILEKKSLLSARLMCLK